MVAKKVRMVFVLYMVLCAVIFISEAQAVELPITSNFGWRVHPISGEWKFHTGIDLAYPAGTLVPAMFDGVVIASGDFGDGYGKQVMLYHPALDAYTRYAHMAAIYASPAQEIWQGTILGCVGATGNATGPHLHLEYIVRAADGTYIYSDPMNLWK